jgi:hypothetical protein
MLDDALEHSHIEVPPAINIYSSKPSEKAKVKHANQATPSAGISYSSVRISSLAVRKLVGH